MLRHILPIVALIACLSAVAFGKGDLTKQAPVTVEVVLGSADGKLRFEPSVLRFETGRLYKLVIRNPSPDKHYFSSGSFAQRVFTRKVEVWDARGKTIAEVKGAIREIELLPGGTAAWFLVPVSTGENLELICTIPGHKEGGMTGRITIF